MSKQIILVLIFFGLAYIPVSAGNISIKGRIVDAEYGNGLAGATISLESKVDNFIADSAGFFNINLKDVEVSDSVLFSCMGFKSIGRTLGELKDAVLMLSPQTFQLKEVTIKKRKPKTKIINGFNLRHYGDRERIPDLQERQNDMIGKPFIGEDRNEKFTTIRTVQVMQEGIFTGNLSWFRSQQRWRFRLRILEADASGRPSGKDLLGERIILTVSDVDYQIFDRTRFDLATNSTLYTNHDFSERLYFGMIKIDLIRYDVQYPPNGIFVFLELLPPVISGGDRLFRLAKMDVGNSGWYFDGRSRQWSRGVHFILKPYGKTVSENIEPAIALELVE